MSHVFETQDSASRAVNEFPVQLRNSLLPLLSYIDSRQLYLDDEFFAVCRRGFGQIVRWVDAMYALEPAAHTHPPLPTDPPPPDLLPIAEVAARTGYSRVRLSDLLKEGRIPGEKRRGRTNPGWYTSVEAVERYIHATLAR